MRQAGRDAAARGEPRTDHDAVVTRRDAPTLTLAHTVREGETLSRIADLYYADPARAKQLAAANGLSDPERLAPGSVIALSFAPDEWDDARRRAAALEPYNRGVDAMEAGDFDRAQREFQSSLQTAPELTDAQYNLALVLMKRGQHQEAERTLRTLIVPAAAGCGHRLRPGQLPLLPDALRRGRRRLPPWAGHSPAPPPGRVRRGVEPARGRPARRGHRGVEQLPRPGQRLQLGRGGPPLSGGAAGWRALTTSF